MDPNFETVLDLGRRAAHARRARQRRRARGRPPRPGVRRRGHRPVPHRAHVHGRGPPAEDAGDDHGLDTRRTAAPRWRSCCRCSRPTSRACSRRWRACRSRSACSTRRCTSSCPSEIELLDELREARTSTTRRGRRARADAQARAGALRGQPDARHARLPPRHPLPRDLRDAGRARSCAPRRRCASAPAAPPHSR